MPAQLWLEIGVAGFAAFAAIFWAFCGAVFVPPDRAGIDYNAPQSVVSELQRSVKKQSHWNKLAAWMACASAAGRRNGSPCDLHAARLTGQDDRVAAVSVCPNSRSTHDSIGFGALLARRQAIQFSPRCCLIDPGTSATSISSRMPKSLAGYCSACARTSGVGTTRRACPFGEKQFFPLLIQKAHPP